MRDQQSSSTDSAICKHYESTDLEAKLLADHCKNKVRVAFGDKGSLTLIALAQPRACYSTRTNSDEALRM